MGFSVISYVSHSKSGQLSYYRNAFTSLWKLGNAYVFIKRTNCDNYRQDRQYKGGKAWDQRAVAGTNTRAREIMLLSRPGLYNGDENIPRQNAFQSFIIKENRSHAEKLGK